MAEVKEKRTRKPRRNYKKEMAALRLYCEVSIEVLQDPLAERGRDSAVDAFDSGKVTAFQRVLAKMDGGAK